MKLRFSGSSKLADKDRPALYELLKKRLHVDHEEEQSVREAAAKLCADPSGLNNVVIYQLHKELIGTLEDDGMVSRHAIAALSRLQVGLRHRIAPLIAAKLHSAQNRPRYAALRALKVLLVDADASAPLADLTEKLMELTEGSNAPLTTKDVRKAVEVDEALRVPVEAMPMAASARGGKRKR